MKLSSVCIGMDVLVNGQKRQVTGIFPGGEKVFLADWPEPVHPSRLDWADGRKPGCEFHAVGLVHPSAFRAEQTEEKLVLAAIAEAKRGYLHAGGDPDTLTVHPWQWRATSQGPAVEVHAQGTWKGER